MKNQKTLRIFRNVVLAALFCGGITPVLTQTINLQLQNDYTTGLATATPILTVGDVNNDGRPDLCVLNKSNPTATGPIAVFLNNGAGGFSAPINITDNTGLSPNSIALGDYNHDGFLDMALSTDNGGGINIRLGNGTGNFPTGTYIAIGGGTFKILAADFNGDGNLDLVSEINQVSATDLKVLFGNGTGGFSAATSYAVLGHSDFAVSDFNVDGKPDIATSGGTVVRIYLNNGAGVFTAAPDVTTTTNINRIVSADFNRDCIPDLAFSGSTTVGILLGNGAGGFTAQPTIPITNSPSDMVVGDFNRDKKVDLAIRRNTLTAGANNFTILPGNGSGGFGTAFELSLAVPTSSVEMRLATIDANKDGKADIIIGRQGGFFLYHGNSALFTRTEDDFDGDLRTDLSVFRPSVGDWYIQKSTEGFVGQHWGNSTDQPVAADYDGDGRTDLAVWRANGWGDPERSYFFIFQSSNSTFRPEQFGSTGDVPTVVGDWDGDGRADVAVYRGGATAGAQSFFFYRPSASPGVDFRVLYWGTNGDQAVRGDFDGDGRQDAAIFRPSNALWYVMQSSNGQPLYQSWGLATDKRVSADYDGDGRTDFAVFRPSDGIWYILNSATGTRTSRPWGNNTDALTPADYNGDGKADIAVYRPSDQRWYTPQCGDFKMYGVKFGLSSDTAVPSTLFP